MPIKTCHMGEQPDRVPMYSRKGAYGRRKRRLSDHGSGQRLSGNEQCPSNEGVPLEYSEAVTDLAGCVGKSQLASCRFHFDPDLSGDGSAPEDVILGLQWRRPVLQMWSTLRAPASTCP